MLARLGEDLVVDVGDVARERDVVVVGQEPAPDDVERDTRAQVPDVGLGLRGGTAQIDRDMPGPDRLEVAQRAGFGVENALLHNTAVYSDDSSTLSSE